jgi:hypothetical protein
MNKNPDRLPAPAIPDGEAPSSDGGAVSGPSLRNSVARARTSFPFICNDPDEIRHCFFVESRHCRGARIDHDTNLELGPFSGLIRERSMGSTARGPLEATTPGTWGRTGTRLGDERGRNDSSPPNRNRHQKTGRRCAKLCLCFGFRRAGHNEGSRTAPAARSPGRLRDHTWRAERGRPERGQPSQPVAARRPGRRRAAPPGPAGYGPGGLAGRSGRVGSRTVGLAGPGADPFQTRSSRRKRAPSHRGPGPTSGPAARVWDSDLPARSVIPGNDQQQDPDVSNPPYDQADEYEFRADRARRSEDLHRTGVDQIPRRVPRPDDQPDHGEATSQADQGQGG